MRCETISQSSGSLVLLKTETERKDLDTATGDESDSRQGRIDMLNCRSNEVQNSNISLIYFNNKTGSNV